MAANYRPVSNLSVLLKLLERVVNQQIEEHLSRDGHFPSHQSAYRKHQSTETVLIRVCSDIITRLDNHLSAYSTSMGPCLNGLDLGSG